MRLLVCLLLGGPPSLQAADSMRCGSRLVSVEDRAAEILSACGEPDFRDVFSYPHPQRSGTIADVEQWTYNFGPNQLLRVLKLRNGKLVDIEAQGYGFNSDGRNRCDPYEITEGLSKYRLLLMCGEPLTRREGDYVRTLKPRNQRRYGGLSTSRGHYSAEVYREEWVYNFGSQYRLKVLTLEDGRIADVENGDRGFDSR